MGVKRLSDEQMPDARVIMIGKQAAKTGRELLSSGKQLCITFTSQWSNSPSTGSVIGGGVAFVVGYLVVYATSLAGLTALRINHGLAALGITNQGEAIPPLWKLAGWLFYGSHSVSINIPTQSSVISRNFVTVIAHGLSQLPYYALPPLLLAGMGFIVTTRTEMPTVQDATKTGASLLLGYQPLALLGAYLTRAPIAVNSTTISIGPNTWMAAVYAGGVYPLVFGSIGGLLAYVNRHADQMAVGNDEITLRHDPDPVTNQAPPHANSGPSSNGERIVGMGDQTLSDIEHVMELVDAANGRIKQKELVRQTGWSEAKVSRVTSALEEDGYLEKLQIGRENVIKKLEDLGARRGVDSDTVPGLAE